MDYIYKKKTFDRYNNRKPIEEAECSGSWKTEQKKNNRNKHKEGTSKPSTKNDVLWIIQPEQVEKQVTPTIKILMQTHQDGV